MPVRITGDIGMGAGVIGAAECETREILPPRFPSHAPKAKIFQIITISSHGAIALGD